MSNYRMRFLAMEDEDDSNFDDRSLQHWKRQKMRVEQAHENALVSRDKVRRELQQGHKTSTQPELEAKLVHEAECVDTVVNVVEPNSPDVTYAPSLPDNSVEHNPLSVCTVDEEQCVILSSPSLSPSPRKTRGHGKQGRGRSSFRYRDKGQTSLHQFATTTHRSMSDSLKAQKLKSSRSGPAKRKISYESCNDTTVRPSVSMVTVHKPSRQTLKGDPSRSPSAGASAATSTQGAKRASKKQCPFYKRIPDTGMVVDAFSYGSILNCPAYFLSHFHSDHYMGLNRRFQHPIYCTQVTANLVEKVLKVSSSLLNPLSLDEPCIVEGVEVTLIDANHCPGSVMFLFKTTSGRNYLHTGDFRYCTGMTRHPSLKSLTIHQLFMDTTYCKPQYSFPTQQEVIEFAVRKSREAIQRCPDTVVVCGTYTVGKERVFLALAEALGGGVCVTKEKEGILRCLQWPTLEGLLTTEPLTARVHVLPMKKLNVKDLSVYLETLLPSFSRLLAFIPTGWSHSNSRANLSTLPPRTAGSVSVYSIPYSEHSSFTELKQFVECLQPQRVIPTVGNQSAHARNEMMHYVQQWMKGQYPNPIIGYLQP